MSPSPLSTLCLRCGLCCDGTLFTHVPLSPEEVAGLRAREVGVEERADGTAVLPQPCPALEGRGCALYEDRPKGCRRYQCMLFTALSEGEVTREEALAVVDEAHALLAKGKEQAEPFLRTHFLGRHRRD